MKQFKTYTSDALFEIHKFCNVYVSPARKLIIAEIGDVKSQILSIFPYEPTEGELSKFLKYTALQGITPAVEVVLIKQFINSEIADKCTEISGKSLKELLKIQEEIHNIILHEVHSFRYNYYTLIKLSEFIDKKNILWLTEHQVDNIVSSFNNVVTTRESINRERASSLFSWVGVTISLILSFLGIRDIIEFINRTYNIFPQSNKVILFYTSITLWALLAGFIILIFYKYRRSKK